MMNYLDKYKIVFGDLPVGQHEFLFEIDDKFFAEFEESDVKHGRLTANVVLTKMNNVLTLETGINGNVVVACDRCLDDTEIPVEFNGTAFIKYVQAPDQMGSDDDVIYIAHGDDNLNLAQYLYESIILSLPLKRVHANESDCNQEMIKKLKQLTKND